MPIDQNDVVRQPLLSTGTTAPGFKKETNKPQQVIPQIGDTIAGDEKDENKG